MLLRYRFSALRLMRSQVVVRRQTGTYHFMNNVTRDASGVLFLEPLNDANAIAEYKGESRTLGDAVLYRHSVARVLIGLRVVKAYIIS